MIFIVGSDLIRAEKSDTGTNWRTVNRKRRLDGSWAELAFILWTVQRSISWPQSVWLDEAMLCSRQASWGCGRYSRLILAWDQQEIWLFPCLIVLHSPSFLMPILKHFLRRQCWHWLRWCWSIGQLREPRHWYVRFRLTDRLKKLLQPAKINNCLGYLSS